MFLVYELTWFWSVLTTGLHHKCLTSHLYLRGIQVRIFQENGGHVGKHTFQMLLIDKSRIKLFKGRTTRAKEEYSSSMQVCILPYAGILIFFFLFYGDKRTAGAALMSSECRAVL